MAEYGEWNRKGAALSDVTAKKEYGVGQVGFVFERHKREFPHEVEVAVAHASCHCCHSLAFHLSVSYSLWVNTVRQCRG
jgi:hypothetical protein